MSYSVAVRPSSRGPRVAWTPMCGRPLLCERAFVLVRRAADELGEPETRAEHVPVGLLRDARGPVGTQLSRRSRPGLSALGFGERRVNPVRVLLNARGLSLERLHAAVLAELRPVG